jgi:hypothetical protein
MTDAPRGDDIEERTCEKCHKVGEEFLSENDIGMCLCDDCNNLPDIKAACKRQARADAEQDLTGQDMEAYYGGE